MKTLKGAQFKFIAWLAAFIMAFAVLFTGAPLLRVNAEDTSEKPIYIDTNVKAVVYSQHPGCVFFGFELTESDYSEDFDGDGKADFYQGDFGGQPEYEAYESYIRFKLTYWENFKSMNSEGVELDQLYAYWNSGWDGKVNPLNYNIFKNTVAQRSDLKLLEYGFMITFPAGTTFPSSRYVKGGCQGAPIIYRTTEARAFYFDGTEFKMISVDIATARADALREVNSVNLNAYAENAEREEVKSLIDWAKENINLSFTGIAVEDVLTQFYAELDKIMSLEDYAALAAEKESAKQTLKNFFESEVSQSDYEDEEWNQILAIQAEYSAVVDGVASVEDVQNAILGVKFAVSNVLTKAEKAEFATYCAGAIARVEGAFDEALYREAEIAEAEALIADAKQAIENAANKGEVDAAAAEYIARIQALKTKAQWNEEESQNQNQSSASSDEENTSKDSGCGSVVSATSGLVAAVVFVAVCMIKKKKDGLER